MLTLAKPILQPLPIDETCFNVYIYSSLKAIEEFSHYLHYKRSGAQPGFWSGGGPNLGPSPKGGPGCHPQKLFENVHAIWCICSIKSIA